MKDSKDLAATTYAGPVDARKCWIRKALTYYMQASKDIRIDHCIHPQAITRGCWMCNSHDRRKIDIRAH